MCGPSLSARAGGQNQQHHQGDDALNSPFRTDEKFSVVVGSMGLIGKP